jgi:hypothetical protein
MDMVVCPHCKSNRIITSRVPKDVVAVMPCPNCHELAVLFRDKIIPINRRILEEGSREERTQHLAQVITEFLEAGILPFHDGTSDFDADDLGSDEPVERLEAERTIFGLDPISDKEAEKFTRVDLKCLDDSSYFKRHFGK